MGSTLSRASSDNGLGSPGLSGSTALRAGDQSGGSIHRHLETQPVPSHGSTVPSPRAPPRDVSTQASWWRERMEESP